MDRRSFLAAGALGTAASALAPSLADAESTPRPGGARIRLRTFDYRNVTLHRSRFLDQVRYAREAYYRIPDDDILKGFRRDAGLPAPGNDLKGWASRSSGSTFGQWLSGMARMSRALGDAALRDKAVGLGMEWQRIVAKRIDQGNEDWGTYRWEKTFQGLLDLVVYADEPRFVDTMTQMTRWATANFDRTRAPATPDDRDGRKPAGTLEWYTLAENPLRAYQLTGDRTFLDFAKLWNYEEFWGRFADTARPTGAGHRHSYSHVNSFSSAAMFHAVTGDPRYLNILRNAYDWLRGTQTFASGGFGPGEWTVEADGSLGRSLETRADSAELPCGSWAGFKLARYLTGFTGEARYGDWVETLLHNGIGAALPIQPDGRSFYFADYRVGMGLKTYFWDEYPCCSGTYIQAIADYHNILYQQDDDGLYVSQIVPSEVRWTHRGQNVTLTTETRYPVEEETRFVIKIDRAVQFALRLRIPAWCRSARILVNGAATETSTTPGEWASVSRRWRDGDVVTLSLPMSTRLVPIDEQHPDRVAIMYGPLLMAQDARYSYSIAGSKEDVLASLQRRNPDEPLDQPGPRLVWTPSRPYTADSGPISDLTPIHGFRERLPYRSYFDLPRSRLL